MAGKKMGGKKMEGKKFEVKGCEVKVGRDVLGAKKRLAEGQAL